MTLPSLGDPSDQEGGVQNRGTQVVNERHMRPTARILRDQRKHILHNIKWSRSLEDDLVGCGLLPDSEPSLDDSAKTVRVLDEIVQRRSAEGMRQLLTLLESHNNEDLATALKADMETQTDNDASQGATGVDTETTQNELLVLRKRLEDSERQARQWKLRAQHLETEKLSLESTLKLEGKELTPEVKRVSPEKKESPREQKGLLLARKNKETTFTVPKGTEETATVSVLKFDHKIEGRAKELAHKDKQRRRGVTDPGRLLLIVKTDEDKKASTLPVRLPSLAGAGRQETSGKLNKTDVSFASFRPESNKLSVNKTDILLGKYAPLPSIDNLNADELLAQDVKQQEIKTGVTQPESRGPRKEWSEEGLSCKMNEKWIDKSGGEIQLPNVVLHIPPNSVAQPVLISVTETDYAHVRQQQINTAGFEDYFEPGMQLRLQPHGLHFLRPVYLEMKNQKLQNNAKLLVFHKDVEPHIETPWTDITTECSPKVRKNDVILAIESFSIVETIKLLVPVMSLAAGIAIGYKMHASALFNNRLSPCNFYVYYKAPDPFLVVFVEAQHSENNNHVHQMSNESGYSLVGYGSSKYPLMDEESLYFYYQSSSELAGAFPLKLEQCMLKGQRFHVPIQVQSIEDLPSSVYIRRRITGIADEMKLCEIKLGHCPHPSKEPIWEKVLRCHRIQVTKNVDIRNIMPRLREDNIINVNEEEELMAIPVKQRQAGKLLDIIVTKGPDAIKSFTESMEEDYQFIVDKLRAEYKIADASSSENVLMSVPKLVPQPPSKPKMKDAMMGTVA